MKRKINVKSAFSLIELLVVIAIISIMTGVLLVNQRLTVQPKDDVDTAARQLVALIRQEQNNAINGQKIDYGSGMKSVCGLGITWTATIVSTFYQATDLNTSSTTSCVSSGTDLATGSVYGNSMSYKNVTIAPINNYVFFKLPFAGMSSNSNPEKIVLTSTANGAVQHTICIYGNTIKDMVGNNAC